MNRQSRTDAPPPPAGGPACTRRRWLGAAGALAAGAAVGAARAQDGLRSEVGRESRFANLVPAEQVEAAADQQYRALLRQAASQKALAPASHPQLVRLRAIADRIVPFTPPWNPRARRWRWEVNLLGSRELNAFCMPGGKIAFYYGILQQLQLSDDEVATVMGHEVAHALREHARERVGKTTATKLGAGLISSLLGLGQVGNSLLDMGSQLLTLKFSREDESEADVVGMDLAARAGYDPRAGVSLWRKMLAAGGAGSPEFLSTHPSGQTRIQEIEGRMPRVLPLYEAAAKPEQRFEPPPKAVAAR